MLRLLGAACYPCQKVSRTCAILQTIGFDFDGGFASHMELPAQAFRREHCKLPSSISDEEESGRTMCLCCECARVPEHSD